jgi:hypothetical protein
LFLKRRMNVQVKRSVKKRLNKLLTLTPRLTKNDSQAPPVAEQAAHFKKGDLVRVRSREEIEATLNIWKEHKNCGFLPEMWSYCGTVQRVLKPVERFVDERDYTVKKTRGLVLLDGVICEGTAVFGRCDRSCFFFWREEWLEKIEESGITHHDSTEPRADRQPRDPTPVSESNG